VLCSCSGTRTEERAALEYEMKTFRIESKGGCDREERPCASFEVTYPVFQGLSSAVSESLMDYVNNAIAYDNPETGGYSIEQMGEQFVGDFERFQNDFPDNGMGWYFKTVFDVNIASDTLISLSASSEYFTGGAHGGYTVYFVNLNPITGEDVTLHSVLKPGFEKVLNSEGEKSFRQVRGFAEDVDPAEEGFGFSGGNFAVNDNYGFTAEGIVFFFNSYEIAAYALGPTKIVGPWEALGEWRR
jgi:hypothetical protein